MGLIDIHLDVSEEEYAYLRLAALKHNSSIPNYIERLIQEDRRLKNISTVSTPAQTNKKNV